KKENIIQQIEKVINDKEESLRLGILAVIKQTDWREEVLTKSTWEEAKDYGNQILALIFIHQELIFTKKAINDEKRETIDKSKNRLEELISLDDIDLKKVLD